MHRKIAPVNRAARLAVLIVVATAAGAAARGEGHLGFWSIRDLDGMTKLRWEAARNRTRDEILTLNRTLKTWPEACEVLEGAAEYSNDPAFLARFVEQLADAKFTRLEATDRLIVWERILSGDLVFPGRGYVVDDDVFTVAGRANWLLRTLTKHRFGHVKPGARPEELAALQQAWKRHFAGETPPEPEDPYPSTAIGEVELRNPLAVEALVRSLAPSAAKTALLDRCLRKVGLTELPADPEAPARHCDPDRYAHDYLAVITDVAGPHDAAWWAAWWEQNRERLRWNRDAGRFETPTPES